MQVTPRSIFFGLVALGLPFAVTLGWTLGEPDVTAPPSAIAPAGAGGMGPAPTRGTATEPVTPVDYGSRPLRPASPAPSASGSSPATRAPSPSAPAVTPSPLLPLTDPPVPTPTGTISTPTPSPTPSGSGAPTGLKLIH